MMNLFKNKFGMNIVGQGGKIILFTLPSLIAAILLNTYLPHIAALPASLSFLRYAGYALLIPGLALWGTAMVQLLAGFPQGKLVTTGAYGVVRNPIYSSATFFLLPAVSLLTLTWVYFVPALFLYAGVMIFIGVEEKQLARAFGKEYEDYLTRVDRLVPFKKPALKQPLPAALVTLLLALGILTLSGCAPQPAVLNETLSAPLSGATSAKVDINRYSGNLIIDSASTGETALASGALPYLDNQELARSATVDGSQANLTLKTDAKKAGFRLPWAGCADDTVWQIHLNPGVPADISARSGGGNLDLKLTGMAITSLLAETGGGNASVILPETAANLTVITKSGGGNVVVELGRLTGSSKVTASSGAGNVVVRLPGSIAARIHVKTGAGKVAIDPSFTMIDKTTYQSAGYDSASDKVEITADSGAGNVTINTK